MTSVIENAKVARYNFVFQHGTGGNVDSISVVGYDDDGSLEKGRQLGLALTQVNVSKPLIGDV